MARQHGQDACSKPTEGQQAAVWPAPVTDEDVRRRRNSANRVLGILRAALNLADSEHPEITNRKEWSGGKLEPFRGVNAARVRYLNVAEAQRFINACDPDLRALVRAGLETGARYGELGRLEVQDFNADVGTVFIQKSKPEKSRHVVLTEEGADFFRQHCAGRAGNEPMLVRANGHDWKTSEQAPRCAKLQPMPALPPTSTSTFCGIPGRHWL